MPVETYSTATAELFTLEQLSQDEGTDSLDDDLTERAQAYLEQQHEFAIKHGEMKSRKDKIVPLQAAIYRISPTGNLTVVFNKPIIIPNIRIHDSKNESLLRRTRDLAYNQDGEQKEIYAYEIGEVVDIWVESDFFEQADQEIQISDYTLTRLAERAFDV